MIPRKSDARVATPSAARYTVIYDGDCAVCQRFIGYLRRRDPEGTVEIVAYQEDGVPFRFPWIDPERFGEALQLVGPGPTSPDSGSPRAAGSRASGSRARLDAPGSRTSGCFEPGPGAAPRETWEGARAIEQLLRVLPRGARLRWVFQLPLARPLFALGYRTFARNRRRFGCGSTVRWILLATEPGSRPGMSEAVASYGHMSKPCSSKYARRFGMDVRMFHRSLRVRLSGR